MKRFLILVVLLLFFSSGIRGQNNVSASAGLAIPEFVNLGIRYQLPQIKVGMSVGTAFTGSVLLSGDFYYHFAGFSALSEVPPWYVRGSVSYWPFGKLLFVDLGEALLISIRVGREVNFTENLGISIDAGIIPFAFLSGMQVPFYFIPGISLSVYSRLLDL